MSANSTMESIARCDQRYVWHPFTQMRDWLRQDPIVIVEGRGALLVDRRGRTYLDANSSIWTNLHGHRHWYLDQAVRRQLGRIAHCSALGLANEPAARLAQALVRAARPGRSPQAPSALGRRSAQGRPQPPELDRVFYSDDGSTAMEVAVKLSFEHARRSGLSSKPRFLSLTEAYHGDTVGAVSLGHVDLFHRTYRPLLFRTDAVMAPYCYRCRFNRAQPERADARTCRCCQWECVGLVEACFQNAQHQQRPYTAMVVEPLIQGAAGMIPQPTGWLSRVEEIIRGHRAHLIADEVMTAFGRTGAGPAPLQRAPRVRTPLFASQLERVQPDFLVLAKGLTGGYLPMAATLTTPEVFASFLGEYEEFKTFFHGHSYTANPLAAATALASLELLQRPASVAARARLESVLAAELDPLWECPQVGDIRRVGLVAGIELVRDWRQRKPFDLRERAGIRVCEAMARRGVLTRPVGNVIVVMPPYCATAGQVQKIVSVLRDAVDETLPGP